MEEDSTMVEDDDVFDSAASNFSRESPGILISQIATETVR